MSMFLLTLTGTPVDITALWSVGVGSAFKARGQNLGQFAIYRMVAATAPTDLDGAVFQYQPGEIFTFAVHSGAVDGNTYFATGGETVRVVLEDNLP